jgi:murein DD-endopeptidase MepM/ murein hydrolase activator NlpD
MDYRIIQIFLIVIGLTLMVQSCNTVKRTFQSDSPHENYRQALLDSKLADRPMVQEWIQSADSSLTEAAETSIPRKTTLTYFKDKPVAYSWKIELQEGRVLHANFAATDTSHQIFLDLFSLDEDQEPSRITSASDSALHYESGQNQTVILRLQPELLVSGSVNLSLTDQPSMDFPVAGASPSNIQSFWGAPRDGGARRHEGVDIFVDRGTPAIAAADGRVSRTGTSKLGGNIVWLRAKGRSLYYAHLDTVIAQSVQQVQVGDTLGFVGNTGNAQTTPPHLHFGIYDNGAVNPLPFINTASTEPAPPTVAPNLIGQWGRIQNAKANIRPLPSTEQPPIASLNRNEAVLILGATGSWYKIRLPDQRMGYVYNELIRSASEPIGTVTATRDATLFENFSVPSPFLAAVSSEETFQLHATYKGKRLVQYRKRLLWIDSTTL